MNFGRYSICKYGTSVLIGVLIVSCLPLKGLGVLLYIHLLTLSLSIYCQYTFCFKFYVSLQYFVEVQISSIVLQYAKYCKFAIWFVESAAGYTRIVKSMKSALMSESMIRIALMLVSDFSRLAIMCSSKEIPKPLV
jgi:hypothetical protein